MNIFKVAFGLSLSFLVGMGVGYSQANLVIDIVVGAGSGVAEGTSYAVGPTHLFFTPQSMIIGDELWSSDGTEEGTVLVKDIWEGGGVSYPTYLTFLQSTCFFVAEDAEHGTELWKSDGTTEGTVLVKDIIPGPVSGAEVSLSLQGMFASEHLGLVFFRAHTDVTQPQELWRTDGTEGGTVPVRQAIPGPGVASPDFFVEVEGIVYFSGDAGSTGQELYRTDGTATGTYLVKDVWPGATSGVVRNLTVAGSKVFFTARTQANGYELWVSDGTTDGTHLVKDIVPGFGGALDPGFLNTLALMPLGDKLVFTARDVNEAMSIWVTDGTENGTELLQTFSGTGFFQADVLDWTELDGKLYLLVNQVSDDDGLWVTDGTVAGTFRSADFNFFTNPVDAQITTVKDHLVISADHAVAGEAIYKTDGTNEGTERIAQATQAIFFGTTSDDKLFFSALNHLGRELWVYEADSTSAVRLLRNTGFTVFPNPVTTHFTIEGPGTGSVDRVELIDLHGRTVRQWNYSGNYQVDLPSGYYQLMIHSKGDRYSHPLIISNTR